MQRREGREQEKGGREREKGVKEKETKTHSAQQIIHHPRDAPRTRRDVFPRHACHSDGGVFTGDVDEAVVEEVKVGHGGEGVRGVFRGGREVRFGVRGRDDGEVWGVSVCRYCVALRDDIGEKGKG